MPHTKEELRRCVQDNLGKAVAELNDALSGNNVSQYQAVLKRLGRGNRLPHWYEQLRNNSTLPNLDGKTIGSVLEMLFVAVLETHILKGEYASQLHINPASGVDLPDLDLGIKTPSENFCTSEPFFSAYERLHGTEYDVLSMLTDYQTTKANPPLRLKVIAHRYLTKTQVADSGLCAIARLHRTRLLRDNESQAKKVFRFLAHVNQSDWRAKRLLRLIEKMYDDDAVRLILGDIEKEFTTTNIKRAGQNKEPIPQEDLDAIRAIGRIDPPHIGVMDAADNWVIETHKEFGRYPNDNEWNRLRDGPLDGKIGMSFALQWRFNFGQVFRGINPTEND